MIIAIPNVVTTVEGQSFYYNWLTSVVILNSVTAIDNYALSSNKLNKIVIKSKSLLSDFTRYGTDIWGWTSGYSDSSMIWNE